MSDEDLLFSPKVQDNGDIEDLTYDPSLDDDDDSVAVATVESNTEDSLKNLNVNTNGEIVNTSMVPVDKITCKISLDLFYNIQEIERKVKEKFRSDQEFSVYLHGDFNDDGELIISDTYYIPKQVVSSASVDYKEEPHAFYNGCLHRHPTGVTSFSGTDKRYINSNFQFSLLYVNQKIHTGIINIPYHGVRRIQMPLRIETVNPHVTEEVDIDNISRFQEVKVQTPPIIGYHNQGIVMPHVVSPAVINADTDVVEDPDQEEFFKYLGV